MHQGTAPAIVTKRKKCVLLIDDCEDTMSLVGCALNEHVRGKYELEWASSLSDGLVRILHGGIDMVLLDLELPESSGPHSYACVRQTAPEVPVVVLSGDTREETELNLCFSGVKDYLVKAETTGSLLVSTIQEALNNGKRKEPLKNKIEHSRTKVLRELLNF